MKHPIFILILIIPILTSSQEKKIEKEERIDLSEMPEKAQTYLRDYMPQKIRRLRYYFETDAASESYEAKFKYTGRRFSVEFNKAGLLQDIEVETEKEELPPSVLSNIEGYISSKHERFRIEKIQAQFLSDGMDMKRSLKPGSIPDNYELIVATKNRGELKKFEMLFDENGNFKEEREIIRNSYDYLIF